MLYDCIIVGGGPAGAICSLILQKQGINCLLFEKRSFIDEKICGGFIPDRCRNRILSCGIDLSEMIPCGNQIDGYFEIRDQKTKAFSYKKDQFGFGVYRRNLDSFLLHQTSFVGTKVVYGETVSDYEKTDDLFNVSGYRGKYIIWATGANPPTHIKAFEKNAVREKAYDQSTGISEIVQIDNCSLESNAVYFWYTEGSYDYFWAIPLAENIWNIGYWTQRNRKDLRSNFCKGRKKWIESGCGGMHTIRPLRGALLGNVNFSRCLIEKNMFCCGDLAGTNNILTGEGIAQAVQSAREIADTIIKLMKQGDTNGYSDL